MAVQAHHYPSVVLVDDHTAVRQALAELLEDEGIHVCAQAAGRDEVLICLANEHPDVVLLDLSLGRDDGLALVAEVRRLGIPVVVCSTHEDPVNVRRAIAAGARAYVVKREAGCALAHAIRESLEGWILVSPRAADDLAAD